jgi:hypothetical protein
MLKCRRNIMKKYINVKRSEKYCGSGIYNIGCAKMMRKLHPTKVMTNFGL